MTIPYTNNYSYHEALIKSLKVNVLRPIMTFVASDKLKFLDLPWKPYYTQLHVGLEGKERDLFNWFEQSLSIEVLAVALTILVTITIYTMEHYLDERQKKMYKVTEFPKDLEEVVKEIDEDEVNDENDENEDVHEEGEVVEDDCGGKKKEKNREQRKKMLPQLLSKFSKSQHYSLDKLSFGILHDAYTIIETVVFILMGALPYTWNLSLRMTQKWYPWSNRSVATLDSDYESQHEIVITLVFFILTTVLGTITSLPWDIYSTFFIERKHGFNKQTSQLFIMDRIKSLVLTFALGCPVLSIVIWLIQWGGEHFYIYVWVFTIAFSCFMMTIVPLVIMPLFNTYKPLEDGKLKDMTYALAGRLKYPLTKMLVMDGSKRSNHSNAFLFGFGRNKRIVLFDTLFKNVTDDEIVSILGHELGHWKLGHSICNFLISQVYFGIIFFCFSLCYENPELYSAFGFNDPNRIVPTIVALTLFFQTLWSPLDKIVGLATTLYSRKCEFEADEFSVNLGMGKDLQRGLVKISMDNLSSMVSDIWYARVHYSHPPLVQRIQVIRNFMKKNDLELKKKN